MRRVRDARWRNALYRADGTGSVRAADDRIAASCQCDAPTVPPIVDAAIAKALARTPADRFASVEEFASAMSPSSEPNQVAAGQHVRRWLVLTATVAAVLALAWSANWQFGSAGPAASAPRIAVLPFENLSGPDDEPFAAGITDEITSRLAEIGGLRVVSRTSAKRFAKRDMSVAELGKALDTDYILEGTVRTVHVPHSPAATWFAFSGQRVSAFARLARVTRLHSLDLFSVIPLVEPYLKEDSRWAPFLQRVALFRR